MTGIKHDEACSKAFADHWREVVEYQEKWPKHCKNCRGWGGFVSSYDPSPAGVSLSPGSMLDFDLCPECAEKELCPRCGGPLPTILTMCSRCKWSALYPEGIAEGPECFCGHEDW